MFINIPPCPGSRRFDMSTGGVIEEVKEARSDAPPVAPSPERMAAVMAQAAAMDRQISAKLEESKKSQEEAIAELKITEEVRLFLRNRSYNRALHDITAEVFKLRNRVAELEAKQ